MGTSTLRRLLFGVLGLAALGIVALFVFRHASIRLTPPSYAPHAGLSGVTCVSIWDQWSGATRNAFQGQRSGDGLSYTMLQEDPVGDCSTRTHGDEHLSEVALVVAALAFLGVAWPARTRRAASEVF